MSHSDWTIGSGDPSRLGATLLENGVNFAVYAPEAGRVFVCLYAAEAPQRELARLALPGFVNGVHHGFVAGVGGAHVYALRAEGPWAPAHGQFFDPARLLLDPWALALDSEPVWHPQLQALQHGADTAALMPRCRILRPPPPLPCRRRRALGEHVIYEAHLGGATRQHPDVPAELRGRYGGFASDAMLRHLQRLEVSAVEFLPLTLFCDERHLSERGLRNYWGYNPVSFFAPALRYASGTDAIAELRALVQRLHEADIDVIVDVVFNHSAESDLTGPTLSYRGLAASHYYARHDNGHWRNDTGCGNTFNVNAPQTQALILASLRYWVQTFGIDGFRFDLAPVLGRDGDDFNAAHSLLQTLRSDPLLAQVHLIAEPWDIGYGGYCLGRFGAPWHEWNDQYRDRVRQLWLGERAELGQAADYLLGNHVNFSQRGPSASVNFITAHDGFTLQDLVSYNARHNEANGEHNRDGHQHNLSCNHGVEGPTQDPQIRQLRQRQVRNLLATLLMSDGVPMLLGGDELSHSQKGNNNAYCQDNALGWWQWHEDDALVDWIAALIRLRRHSGLFTAGHRHRHGELTAAGWPNVAWYQQQGRRMTPRHWRDAEQLQLWRGDDHGGLLLVMNLSWQAADITLVDLGCRWRWCLGSSEAGAPPQLSLPGKSLQIWRPERPED